MYLAGNRHGKITWISAPSCVPGVAVGILGKLTCAKSFVIASSMMPYDMIDYLDCIDGHMEIVACIHGWEQAWGITWITLKHGKSGKIVA